MTVNDLRDALHRAPFRPFALRVADGREYDVPHPDFLFIHPSGRSVIVARLGEHSFEILDVRMIASIHFGNGRKKRNGTSRRKRRR